MLVLILSNEVVDVAAKEAGVEFDDAGLPPKRGLDAPQPAELPVEFPPVDVRILRQHPREHRRGGPAVPGAAVHVHPCAPVAVLSE